VTDPEGGSLWRAITSSNVKAQLALLVKYGLPASKRLKNAAVDTTLLMEVCAVGDLETAPVLLERGADVNAPDNGTPLSRAEESGNQVLVDLLRLSLSASLRSVRRYARGRGELSSAGAADQREVDWRRSCRRSPFWGLAESSALGWRTRR